MASIAASEAWGGPLTLSRVGDAAVAVGGTAVAEVRDATSEGTVHLTFDDGPTPETTAEVLRVLDEYHAEAVFFVVGEQVRGHADLLRRATDDGHAIGNHTWQHDVLVGLSAEDFDSTVGRTQAAVEAATGTTPQCLRPPEGALDDGVRQSVAEAGLDLAMWDVDPLDWRRSDSAGIADEVLATMDDGSVVLLHDGGGGGDQTVAALRRILDEGTKAGYTFTVMPGC